jgi:N4-gp56 family major capsid protein
MADTQIATTDAVTAELFAAETFQEYLDQLVFTKYMGTSPDSLIYVREDLVKGKGDAINVPLVAALDSEGVEGETTLEGHEENLQIHNQRVVVTEYAHAVRDAGNLTKKRTAFDLLAEFRPALTSWLSQKSERLLMNAMVSIGGVLYGTASTAEKNAWCSGNRDRVLYGAATSNLSGASYVHANALDDIDSSNDVLLCPQITLAKRMAQLADPKVRPIRTQDGLEFYVLFAHPYCVRDLKASTTWINAQMYGMPRGEDNPMFKGALGYWEGVLVVECPKIPILASVGASSIDVAMNVLCGAQALVYAQGGYDQKERVRMVEKTFDYGRQTGAAIMSMHKSEKGYFNSKDHGMVTLFSAAVAD